ncbi:MULTISPECIES: DUF397 domain-containing protein [unclassified Streptomyces]|uniref:DUF397 domain-containing protein n=1 Tax=unclassified Streptomyces TaxID=2593676 RepID=UPI0028C3DB3F|nr:MULTISPECIES: DUF397 domain-containing protein [unclassified Streptomyces]WNO75012.1 DUF397 domain-containing protein [Streptomyces sp. AM8-1-1]WST37496.1 DUF397 domain-containing protein [Streptomyces sp. NBC_01167]
MSPDLSTAIWRTSSYSNGEGGACVEVADGFTHVTPVRDSKNPDGPALVFAHARWASFVSAVKRGAL